MMIKPDAMPTAGAILETLAAANLTVANLKMVRLLRKDAEEFYREHHGKHFFDRLVDFMSSGPVLAVYGARC